MRIVLAILPFDAGPAGGVLRDCLYTRTTAGTDGLNISVEYAGVSTSGCRTR